ncbi:PfkB family carbohydrate kinase [Baekduia sp. Peel2402]|uniref:PfkB family carbohydrate kinase n=1 Tax=Baekduia sp. Peel2402 TaxID=3458296 RepID=UPI00403E3879
MRLGVVGHVEWVDFVLAQRLPRAGEIADAGAAWEAAAGGGAMAAYALKSLTGAAAFFCAVGDDARGAATASDLRAAGLDVHATTHAGVPQRRTLTWLTADHERTITTLSPPLEPHGADLPDLSEFDGIALFGGDARAAQAARAAKVLVATARTRAALIASGVQVDALIGSADDPSEPIDDELLAACRPRWILATEGARGGSWREGGSSRPAGRWIAGRPPGDPLDAFGCGDAFAAAVMAALADGCSIEQACGVGARVGAAVLCERAPAVGELAGFWAARRAAP